MQYVMKQKLFCWGDDFTIKDDGGTERFLVDGKTFSLGDKLSFQDLKGQELAFIRQKLLAWGPTYGRPMAESHPMMKSPEPIAADLGRSPALFGRI